MSIEKMRAEFEEWVTDGKVYSRYLIERYENGEYVETYTELAWHAWQASRAALALAAAPRLTGAFGGEFKFVAKWDGSDAHPIFEINNGVFDMAGKMHIAELLIAISDWISEYAESIRITPTRIGIIESFDVRVKP